MAFPLYYTVFIPVTSLACENLHVTALKKSLYSTIQYAQYQLGLPRDWLISSCLGVNAVRDFEKTAFTCNRCIITIIIEL